MACARRNVLYEYFRFAEPEVCEIGKLRLRPIHLYSLSLSLSLSYMKYGRPPATEASAFYPPTPADDSITDENHMTRNRGIFTVYEQAESSFTAVGSPRAN